jgi:hypothetical protein
MTNTLLNSLERTGDTLAIRTNPAKRRKNIESNLVTTLILVAFGIYAWTEHNLVLILINSALCLLTLPLTLFALWIEVRASRKRNNPAIEITPDALRFYLASHEPIVVHPSDVAELILMPSLFGQTLIVSPVDESAFRSRLPLSSRFYLIMSKLYCGHAMGLTPNLAPVDYRDFSQALDRTFPNRVSVRQKAHQPPLLAKLLGNTRPHEAPLAVHVPPPLSKA